MAYGKWSLTTEEEKYFIPLFKYMIDELNCGRRDGFNLSGKGINPAQAVEIMKQLGYPEQNRDYNSWEQNTRYHFENTKVWLLSCGQTFALILTIEK